MYRLGRVGTGTLSHDLNRWFFNEVWRSFTTHCIAEVHEETASIG